MRSRPKRSEKLFFNAEPDLRAAIEAETQRRDYSSLSNTVRALVRAQLAALAKADQQRAA